MSSPELKFELDEYGRIVYRVTDEGVLLSKDEKEFIIDHVTRMQAENAKLRELAERAWKSAERLCQAFDGPCRDDGVTIYKPCPMGERDEECIYGQLQRELRECGVGVDA